VHWRPGRTRRAACEARGIDYGEFRAAIRARTLLRSELADEGLTVSEIADRLAGVDPTRTTEHDHN
jgi:hypothetical protein